MEKEGVASLTPHARERGGQRVQIAEELEAAHQRQRRRRRRHTRVSALRSYRIDFAVEKLKQMCST